MALFPSVLTSFSTKANGQVIDASDINNPQTDITQIEAVIGVAGDNSVVGTYEYFVKSPASNGGGHVQTAVLGGTGQTTFTKGDLLVATSASVLSKLAVGGDGQYLQANSSTAAGIQWGGGSNRVFVQASTITTTGGETSVYSVSIPASTLSTTNAYNAVRMTSHIQDWQSRTGANNLFKFQFGGVGVGSIAVQVTGADQNVRGTITHTIIASTLTLQKHLIDISASTSDTGGGSGGSFENLTVSPALVGGSIVSFRGFTSTLSSFTTGAAQNVGLTIQAGANNTIRVGGVIIEKIT